MSIRSAVPGDLPALAALLAAASLPPLDADFAAADFRVALDGSGRICGAVGVERYGPDGLLRSLVVAADARGSGAGVALVRAIETHARALGLRSLVLLTTTAEAFFQRLGYAAIARDAMPAAVQTAAEFTRLCPASAVCMRRALDASVPA